MISYQFILNQLTMERKVYEIQIFQQSKLIYYTDLIHEDPNY